MSANGPALLAHWDSLVTTTAKCEWLDGLDADQLQALAMELGRRMLERAGTRRELLMALSPEPGADFRR